MVPTDVPTSESLEFVARRLPSPDAFLLEVGCGRGDLAGELASKGVRVRAIDTSPESVAGARARGVDAVQQDFLTYEGGPFDVILFSRSLHHIHPLKEAMEQANMLLKADGILLIEDFGVDLADRRAASWRYDVETLLELASLFNAGEKEYDSSLDPLDRWRAEHNGDHHIADSSAMRNAIGQTFDIVTEERAPYLYRYIVERLEASNRGLLIARHLCAWEKRLIDANELQPTGLRWVARRREKSERR